MFEVKVNGIDRVVGGISRFPRQIARYLRAAGSEAGTIILRVPGLRRYPRSGEGNRPPTPFWVRGVGMQRSGVRGPSYNDFKSERYGTQFYVAPTTYGAKIGNRSSYAEWLGGLRQAKAMAEIGWRRLADVARENITWIQYVYQKWIDRLIRDLGL